MVLPGIVKVLFDSDTSPIRFEHFCVDLCREVSGVELVPTSRTWDVGRDGRGVSLGGRETPVILCATLAADIDAKVESDIRRLDATTKAKAIMYCSSQRLSEKKCDQIKATIRDLCPSVKSVDVLGQDQLGDLAERHEDILRKHYEAEIRNVEVALLQTPGVTREAEEIGLRLALMTQTGENAWELREELARRLILDTLLDTAGLSPAEIAKTIAAQLHLPRGMAASSIEGLAAQLEADGLVSGDRGTLSLTPAGVDAARNVPPDAGAKLLKGRVAVREAIRSLSGHTLMDSQFNKLWDTLQDGLANLFYSQGMAMMSMVRSLLAEETPGAGRGEPMKVLERLADSCEAVFAETTQGSEIRQAVIDMFSEKDSTAFEWLAEICSVYVMMSSLGFESLSGRQTIAALTNFKFVPDSDVVISLLCEGEDNHEDVERILAGWRAIGGKLLMSRPVLEEVAYHAWISEHDFMAMEHQIGDLSETEARRLLENAFVRAFRKVAEARTARKYWRMYIQQYRGQSQWDYAPLMELLRDDHSFDQLPDAPEDCDEFARQVEGFLAEKAAKDIGCEIDEVDFRTRDKCRRDGVLLAALFSARRSGRAAGQQGSTCVITSARFLAEADQAFREELGRPDAVLSTASLGLLLTLTPQVSMGVHTLRCVLFDDLLAARLAPAQRYAYRIIEASEQYEVPWSRRVTLLKHLGQTLFTEARAQGQPKRVVRERVLRSEDPEYSAWVVAKALDSMPGTAKGTEENLRLTREVKGLREEVEVLHQALTSERQAARVPGKRPGAPSRRRKRGGR